MNDQILIFGIRIEVINLVFTMITSLSALSISFLLLRNSIKPRIDIERLGKDKVKCNDTVYLRFRVVNQGYWFARPMVIKLIIFCNFDEAFKLIELQFGSRQEKKDKKIKQGKENMNYFIAEGIMLGPKPSSEEFIIKLSTPDLPGKYRIKFEAYSENGVSFRKKFMIECI